MSQIKVMKEKIDATDPCVQTWITKIHDDIKTKVNFKGDSFYSTWYNTIVAVECEKYFTVIDWKCSTIVTRKLGEEILLFVNKKKTPEIDEIVTKNITDKELAALQYLGGYVLQFFLLLPK